MEVLTLTAPIIMDIHLLKGVLYGDKEPRSARGKKKKPAPQTLHVSITIEGKSKVSDDYRPKDFLIENVAFEVAGNVGTSGFSDRVSSFVLCHS